MALVESLPLLDTLKHEAAWLSKGQWSKMTWAGAEMFDSAAGATASSFGTTSGAFYNASTYTVGSTTPIAASIVHNNSSPVAERFVSIWLCYNDATHSGYRITFVYVTETTMKAVLHSVSSGTETLLGESATFTPEAGMILGAEKTGTSIIAWVKKGGVWTKLSEIANTTFTTGNIGFDGSGANPTFTEWCAEQQGGTVPSLTNPGTQKNPTGVALELKLVATNALTYHAKNLPAGLSLNEVTGVITGTPTKEETVITEVEAVGQGGKSTASFSWTIAAPPSITNPGTQQSGLGLYDELKVPVTHATSVTATGVPPGMSLTFASNTATFRGQPTIPGTYTVKLEATGEGGTSETTFTWIVEPLAIARGKAASIRDKYPLHLTVGHMDFTSLLTETFTFSSVDPGGYEMASFSLPGDLPQILRGMNVRLDCALGVAWEGRVKEVDRTLGTKTLIQCEGYGALLKDTSMREVYVDLDLTKWVGAPLSEKISYLKLKPGVNVIDPIVTQNGGGEPALAMEITGNWEAEALPLVIAYYRANNIELGALHSRWEISPTINPADINWYWQLLTTANLKAAGPEERLDLIAQTTLKINFEYQVGPAGGANTKYSLYWSKIGVYGRHGLTRRGAEPGGLYTYDIVKHALGKVAGLQEGTIADVNVWGTRLYTVPHAIYTTNVPVETIISDMAKFQGAHWGVWESYTPLTGDPRPRLDFRPYPEAPTAWAWRSECEDVDVREDLQYLYDTAMVSFTEAAGNEETVEVKRPNAQLEAAGIKGKTITLNMGQGTEASAKAYGEIVLALLEDQAKCTGTATIAGEIHTMSGGPLPAFLLKAGLDRLRIPDLPSIDAWGENSDLPISRVECTGSPEGITTSISFGRGPNLVEELTARLERATEVAVSGG